MWTYEWKRRKLSVTLHFRCFFNVSHVSCCDLADLLCVLCWGEPVGAVFAERWAYVGRTLVSIAALNGHLCALATWLRIVGVSERTARPSGQVCYPNLRNQRRKEDDVGDFNATWPRYRITSHVQGLKGGAVLNGTMAVELFEEVVCLCHDSSWVVLSYPFLLAGFKMTDKRNSFDKVWIDLQGKTRCE